MTSLNLRASPLPRIMLPLLAGFLALAATRPSAQASEMASLTAASTYVMPANDGYGITECIASGASCGRVVADAWCEAHGHAQAIAFGRAEDATSAIGSPTANGAPVEANSFIVSCGK